MSSFTVDRTPPGEPRAAGSMVTHQTLILHWQAPKSTVVARYVLLVNGRAVRSLPPTTRTLRIKLKHHDRRSFAVAAVDGAGNVGAAAPLFGAQHVAAKQAHTK
jgi:hypothetical protein